jgi:MerR family transcriptional regulator, copper efflux regulator
LNPYARRVADYRISQVVERTGFSAPTLRYYENIGLVRPARRSGAGHRVYDEGAVDRLRFVARAKRLGLTLDEIADLVTLWDAQECRPVQERLRALLRAKQAEIDRQVAELSSVRVELEGVAVRLGLAADDETCGPSCGCIEEAPEPAGAAAVTHDARNPGDRDGLPIVCTLDRGELSERLGAWARLAERITERHDTETGVRVRFASGIDAEKIAELIAAEQRCCAFLSFRLAPTDGDIILEVDAPDDARVMLDALFSAV